MSAPRYVCVHGHFYQPPRENPWLEAVERQESAWPQHDWNERVTDECYGPNSHARILDGDGRIHAIENNYARLSFNFGPTLLSWMQEARPRIYEAVLDADRRSAARFAGHGSAMAQVYNHVILPLATRRDKVTQVRWGIRDFTRRFARVPDGMWLAETAVDVETLEVLAENGIRFTVLAPHQCARVKRPGGAWQDVSGQRVDPRRPYVANLPSGRSIALFFYDGPISRAVAFERLLDDGARFADRILRGFESRDEPQLVHIATDGETYGHHHVYGEMALAVALRQIEARSDVELVTYAEVLELFPPTWEAEIQENTSWSCTHGVERWRSDCGCNSGTGWHQRWRAPLREALDWLRDELAPRYEEAAGALFVDPWEARDAYVDVVLDRSPETLDAFFDTQCERELSAQERRRALELCEMQRHAMLMYTSCGWFFDELSGLETIQVLQYAGRAVQLATGLFGDFFQLGFRERLARAPSNRPEYGDGEGVYDAFVEPAKVDLFKVGAHFAINAVFPETPERSTVGGFEGELVEHELARTGSSRLAVGRLRVRSRITTEAQDLSFAVLHFGDHNLLAGVRPFEHAPRHVAMQGALTYAFARADLTEVVRQIERLFGGSTFSVRSLFHDEQAAVLARLLEARTRAIEETYGEIYDQTAPLMRFLFSLDQPPPPVFHAAAEFTLMARLRRALSAGTEIDLALVAQLLEEASESSVALDPVVLGRALEGSLGAILDGIRARPDDLRLLERAVEVAGFTATSSWKIDLGEAQTAVWNLLRSLSERPSLPYPAPSRDERRALLERVAVRLRIRVGG